MGALNKHTNQVTWETLFHIINCVNGNAMPLFPDGELGSISIFCEMLARSTCINCIF